MRDYLDQLRRTREDFLSRGKSTKSIDRQIEDWSRVAKSLDATAALLARVRKIIGQN